MANVGFFDKTMVLLQKVLDLRALNQEVIASNVANAETPGYIPARLEFEDNLRQAVRSSNMPNIAAQASQPGHFSTSTSGIEAVEAKVIRHRENYTEIGDGNEVDKNQEMISLAENQLLYETAVQMLNKKFGMLKYIAQQN